jgi:hypothetical protein
MRAKICVRWVIIGPRDAIKEMTQKIREETE